MIDAVCQWCLSPFVPIRDNQKFCSPQHRDKYHNKYKVESTKILRDLSDEERDLVVEFVKELRRNRDET